MFWFNQHNWICNWSKDLIVDTAKTYSSAINVNLSSINVNCKDKLRLEFYNKMSLYCLISPKSHTLSADHQDSFETKHSLGDFVFLGPWVGSPDPSIAGLYPPMILANDRSDLPGKEPEEKIRICWCVRALSKQFHSTNKDLRYDALQGFGTLAGKTQTSHKAGWSGYWPWLYIGRILLHFFEHGSWYNMMETCFEKRPHWFWGVTR